MQVIRDNPGRQLLQNSVVTIGNFDGLHIGHQALLKQCKQLARDQRPIAVITFEPLPLAWFRPDAAPARLMSVRQKLEFLSSEGIDLVWMMRFNQALADMSADEFVRATLVQTLAASEVVVGDDFHYGKARQGDTKSLQKAGEKFGFGLTTVATVDVDEERASSTRLRSHLANGDFAAVERLTGRPYRTQGRVIRGRQLGRKLGYPTVNMRLAVSPSPLNGVFAVRARVCEGSRNSSKLNAGKLHAGKLQAGNLQAGKWQAGVASLGTRPAVGGDGFLVEVHLFDFDADLYGQRMEVEYMAKLRNEENFEDIDDLVKQMREDERLARQLLR
jgi:riboflavin kinase/FMN adenylyltransferase